MILESLILELVVRLRQRLIVIISLKPNNPFQVKLVYHLVPFKTYKNKISVTTEANEDFGLMRFILQRVLILLISYLRILSVKDRFPVVLLR